MLREIDQCIERVSTQRDRKIFWLYYQRGLTAKDIAELPSIGLNAKGVESCIYRLTKAVRLEVTAKYPESSQRSKGKSSPSTLGETR